MVITKFGEPVSLPHQPIDELSAVPCRWSQLCIGIEQAENAAAAWKLSGSEAVLPGEPAGAGWRGTSKPTHLLTAAQPV